MPVSRRRISNISNRWRKEIRPDQIHGHCLRSWSKLSGRMMRPVSAMCVLAVLIAVAVAQQVPDFSGTYGLKSHAWSDSYRSASSNVMVGRVIRKVMQDNDSVE